MIAANNCPVCGRELVFYEEYTQGEIPVFRPTLKVHYDSCEDDFTRRAILTCEACNRTYLTITDFYEVKLSYNRREAAIWDAENRRTEAQKP